MTGLADRRSYSFGRFRLDPAGRILFRGKRAVPPPPKATDTLLLLVQNAGDVIERRDLLKQVWRDAFVEEGSLTRTISILRKALDAGGQEFITTVLTRGYRFTARVEGSPSALVPSHPFQNHARRASL